MAYSHVCGYYIIHVLAFRVKEETTTDRMSVSGGVENLTVLGAATLNEIGVAFPSFVPRRIKSITFKDL